MRECVIVVLNEMLLYCFACVGTVQGFRFLFMYTDRRYILEPVGFGQRCIPIDTE